MGGSSEWYMRIRTKSVILATIVTALLVAGAVALIAPIESARSELDGLHALDSQLADEMNHVFHEAMSGGYRYLATGDPAQRRIFDARMASFADLSRKFENIGGRSNTTNEGQDAVLIQTIVERRAALLPVASAAFDERAKTGTTSVAAFSALTTAADDLNTPLNRLATKEFDNAAASRQHLSASILLARKEIIGVGLAAFIIAILIGLGVSLQLARPLLSLRDAATRIAGGDMDAEITLRRGDEVGDLAEALRGMQRNLKAALGRLESEVDVRRSAEESQRSSAEKLRQVNAELGKQMGERERADAAMKIMNEQLMRSLSSVERIAAETEVLNEMGELLQTNLGLREAYDVVAQYAGRLFPGALGAVYMLTPSDDMVELEAAFGGEPAGPPLFPIEECWALRSSKAHFVGDGAPGLMCPHFHDDDTTASHLCVPLVAHGETIGSISLALHGSETAVSADEHPSVQRQLAVRLAEHVALALSNLRLRERLREQSIRDPLTGLFNRRYLEETLDREVARAARGGSNFSLMMIDVDHFKEFNDDYGHEAGDTVLAAVGRLLRDRSRVEDIACRYGGEEFVLVMPGASAEVAAKRAEEVREGIRALQVSSGLTPLGHVAVSIGVATQLSQAMTAGDVLKDADAALYRAKAQGRDRVCVARSTQSRSGAKVDKA
jgi:diguanylate cyclase (GGDEF)-like protein